MKTTLRITAFFCLMLSFTTMGCGELFDCIANARPTLPSKTFTDGQTGMAYNESIQASVRNAPNDNSFIYYLSVDNNLPPGLSYHQEGRRLVITGVPTTAGTYTFKVALTIEYPDHNWEDDEDPLYDSNNICFGNDSTSKNYTIVVY